MKLHLKSLSIITAVLLVISLFFNIVLAVSGETFDPGSDQDPIVSKSYVDTSVQTVKSSLEMMQGQYSTLQASYDALKKSVDELTAKASAQEQAIKALQEALKTSGTKPSSGGSSSDTQNTGTSNSNTNTAASKGTANVASLNVRSQANTTSDIVVKLVKGESVTVLSKSGEWYKIKTSKGKTGWVLGKYLTVK
jgi:hypothetical protein